MKKLFAVSVHGPLSAGSFKAGFVLLVGIGFGFAFWTATATPPHQECVVCHNIQHNPHTLTIDCNALPAHLAHGDTEGPCEITPIENP